MATGMEKKSLEELLRLRAYYLWEADGRPEGRSHEYWEKARAWVLENATSAGPSEEMTAAESIPEKPAKKPVKSKEKDPVGIKETAKASKVTAKTSKPALKPDAKSAPKPAAKSTAKPKASGKSAD